MAREQVLERAGLTDTTLPSTGDIECSGCAHGYLPFGGKLLDATRVDPSMAGASGGHALMMKVESSGVTAIGHLGGTAGYHAFMLYIPESERYLSGVVTVTGNFGP